jgi:hypothetical protein
MTAGKARAQRPPVPARPAGPTPDHARCRDGWVSRGWWGLGRLGEPGVQPLPAWLRQLDPAVTREMEDALLRTIARLDGTPFPSTTGLATRWLAGRAPALRHEAPGTSLETAYCAEVLAETYQAMGLLAGNHRPNWYDAGRFWSGNDLGLSAGFRLGGEIAVVVPAS